MDSAKPCGAHLIQVYPVDTLEHSNRPQGIGFSSFEGLETDNSCDKFDKSSKFFVYLPSFEYPRIFFFEKKKKFQSPVDQIDLRLHMVRDYTLCPRHGHILITTR